jgi:uroporphyrinogen decarboxylase
VSRPKGTRTLDFRTPLVFPLVVCDHAARVSGVRIRDAAGDAALLADVTYRAYRTYSYDMIMVFIDTVVEAEAMGCRIERPEDDNAFYVAPPARMPAPADPERDGRMPVVLEAARLLLDMVGRKVPVLVSIKGPFSLASFLAGFEQFLEHTIIEPDAAHAALRVALENQRGYAEAITRLGGIPFIGDPVASGNLISPEVFRSFALPYLKELVRFIHRTGTWTGLHICGNVTAALADMATTGADVLSIEQPDLGKARDVLGPNVVLMGNVPTQLVLESDPATVRAAATDCLRQAGPNLVLSTACDVPADSPVENVRAIVEAARKSDLSDWSDRS